VLDNAGLARDWRGRFEPSVARETRPALWRYLETPVTAGVGAIPRGGFDIAAIRPGFMRAPPNAEGARPARFWTWPLALSFSLHVAALGAILAWPLPAPDAAPPEAVAVEIVVETPSPAPAVDSPPPTIAPHAADEATTLSPPLPPPPAVVEAPSLSAPMKAVEPAPAAEAPIAPLPPPPAAVEAPLSPPPAKSAEPQAIEGPSPGPPAPPPPPAVVEPARPSISPPPPAPAVPRPALTPVAKPPPTPTHVKAPSERAKRALALAAPSEAPAAAKPQAPALTISSAEIAAYQNSVLGRISGAKRYPEAARERESRGIAVVRFSITPSGQVAGASLAQSAGDAILDSEALATVRRASPFPPPPPGAPRTFSATLSYRLR